MDSTDKDNPDFRGVSHDVIFSVGEATLADRTARRGGAGIARQ